jgi:hypothetical protein
MTVPPMSPAQMDALVSLVEAYICPIQAIPHRSTEQPPGRHDGTGWLYERAGHPFLITCEHVSRRQKYGAVGFNCHGSEFGTNVDGTFVELPFPVDAAIASIDGSFGRVPHQARCATRELMVPYRDAIQGELFYVYGFPGADARQGFGTQAVHALSAFVREEELNEEVYGEEPPHPDAQLHICLSWSPARAAAVGDTKGALSLPDGMSGSPLWNTRYEEITRQGRLWKPEEARITGIVWGHSAKACQIYATPIEAFAAQLLT